MVFFPPASSKWVLAFGCGVEVALVQWKKKRDCFPVRGAFWENRGSAYRSQPSKAFEGVLTSPLLKSFHPSKRATSSRIQEHLTCLTPTAAAQPHCCDAAVRVMLRSMGNVQSTGPQSTHTHSKQCTQGTLTSRHFFACLHHLCNPAAWPSYPVTEKREAGAPSVTPFSDAS